MNVNLEKELKASSKEVKKNLNHENIDISEIQGLLEYKSTEDSFIMDNLGISSLNRKMMEDKGKLITMEKIENATNLTVVLATDLKKLSLKYKLRLLPVQHYRGIIPNDIVNSVKDLETRKRETHPRFTKFDEHNLKNDFYILAPATMFKLEPRKKGENNFSIFTNNLKEHFRKMAADPILLYKETDDHFVIVKKWGNDFTILRRLLGLITKNEKNFITSLLLGLAFLTCCVAKFTKIDMSITGPILFFGSMTIIAGVLLFAHKNVYSINNWNSTTK